MNKKGFTLVELLAVIAILAILVIIALPNIMSMFNDARKNSFTTEVRQVYKVAQQTWITDSLMGTSEKVYSRCSSCSGKSLDLSGRTQLEYYIKIDKAGKVVEYYATDGSYQYKYNGGDLNIQDINNVQEVASLQESEIISISDSGTNAESSTCESKIYTTMGSFSYTSQVNEICFSLVDDGYTYSITEQPTFANDLSFSQTQLFLHVNYRNLRENDYIKVYSDYTKTQLLKEVKYSDKPAERANLYNYGDYWMIKLMGDVYFSLGRYDKSTVFVETSRNLSYEFRYGYLPNPTPITIRGPWITDPSVIQKLEILDGTADDLDYYLFGMIECDGTSCPVGSYQAIFIGYNNGGDDDEPQNNL